MKIIISPAKQMRHDDILRAETVPVFLKEAEQLKQYLQSLSRDELKRIWNCSDRLLEENLRRLETMDLDGDTTPALFAYDGIQYKYLAPNALTDAEMQYLGEHLRILSGFYGVLRPADGVVPYRLEMQAKTDIGGKDLYAFWGDRLYRAVLDESRTIVNLASEEYAKCVTKNLDAQDTLITCTFAEKHGTKLVQKGVYCKMARGAMVRWAAENRIEDVRELKGFDLLGFRYDDTYSTDREYVFTGTAGR